MRAHQTTVWLSCYLYYQGSPDDFVIQEVWPFIRQTLAKKQCSSFFFIRYRDARGPHIRLRFNSNPKAAAEIKANVSAMFPSVRFVRYVPEVRRYGGRQGVVVAERLFTASSVAILACMSKAATWEYNHALGRALQLHIGMLSGLGMPRPEAAALCEHIASSRHQGEQAVLAQLAAQFDGQRDRLVPQLEALWSMCEKPVKLKDAWFLAWQQEIRAISSQLRTLQTNHQLRIPEIAAHQPNQLWYLYESYMHMTNNRLGLSAEDELFVAYILQESLKQHG